MSLGSLWEANLGALLLLGARPVDACPTVLSLAGLDGNPAGAPAARCLRASRFALESYEALCQTSSTWRAHQERLARWWPPAPGLLADLFVAYFDEFASLRADVPVDDSQIYSLLAELMATLEFRRTRERTRGDAVAASAAALRAAETMAAVVAEEEQRARRRVWPLKRSRPLPERRGMVAVVRGAGGRRALAAARFAARGAAKEAECALDTLTAVRDGWGILPGEKGVHAVDDVFGLVDAVKSLEGWDQLTDALRRFKRLLGSSPARARRRRRHPGMERIAGYTWGRQLERLAPEEAARMADPDTEALFDEAYEHCRLLQLDGRGHVLERQGPVICCMDTSASMNAPAALGRERFLWCKGVGLALLDYAKRERRPYLGLCFSSESDLQAFSFPAGKYRPEEAIALARCDFNGGTHFERPLAHALEAARSGQWAGANNADLVFVADGEASIGSAFAAGFARQKSAAGLRMITVFIDGFNEPLAALSDATFCVDSGRVDSWEAAVRAVGARLARR